MSSSRTSSTPASLEVYVVRSHISGEVTEHFTDQHGLPLSDEQKVFSDILKAQKGGNCVKNNPNVGTDQNGLVTFFRLWKTKADRNGQTLIVFKDGVGNIFHDLGGSLEIAAKRSKDYGRQHENPVVVGEGDQRCCACS